MTVCLIHESSRPVYPGIYSNIRCTCTTITHRDFAQAMTVIVEVVTGRQFLHSGWCDECNAGTACSLAGAFHEQVTVITED